MMDFHHLRIEQSTDGAQTVWLDVSNRPVNALSEALLDEIEALIDQWESKAPRLVLVSKRQRIGVHVGADLKKICNIQSDGEIQEYLLRGQRLLARFQALKFPTSLMCMARVWEVALSLRWPFNSVLVGMIQKPNMRCRKPS